jgi:hypothetical protein
LWLRIETDALVGGVKKISDNTGRTVSSSSSKNLLNRWFVTVLPTNVAPYTGADMIARASDYEFRFTDNGSYVDTLRATAFINGNPIIANVKMPFEVWNVTDGQAPQQMTALVGDVNRNGELNPGEAIRIVNIPYKYHMRSRSIQWRAIRSLGLDFPLLVSHSRSSPTAE